MAGRESQYRGGVSVSTLKYFGIRLAAAGEANGDVGPDTEEIVVQSNGVYRKVALRDGRVVGLLFAGDVERAGVVFGLLREGVDVNAFKPDLVADDFGLACFPTELRQQVLSATRLGGD